MSASTTKKAILRRFEKEPVAGYVNPISFLKPTGVELLSAEGHVSTVPYAEIKTVCFVRDFEALEDAGRRIFNTRPKIEGLWLSLEFRDGEVLEGILPNDLLQLEPLGFMLVPPDSSGNNQRVFAPRAALRSAEILGVVGSPLRRRRAKTAPKDQIGLFDD